MSWASTAQRLATTALRALGNDVRIGVVSGRGILVTPTESVFDGALILTDYMLELDASVWSTVLEGTEIIVDGVTYLAREQSRVNRDGSSVLVPLELAPPLVFTILNGDWMPLPPGGEPPGVVIDGDWMPLPLPITLLDGDWMPLPPGGEPPGVVIDGDWMPLPLDGDAPTLVIGGNWLGLPLDGEAPTLVINGDFV